MYYPSPQISSMIVKTVFLKKMKSENQMLGEREV